MNIKNIKRFILLNLPYVFLWWLFDKVGEAYRTAYGVDTLKKLVGAVANLNITLAKPTPSFDPFDILVGLTGAAAIYLTVLYKKNHARKWRKDVEYGSARWGNKSDIAPYVDDKPDQNIILTATESLTLNGRLKNPKYARNKNVMIVGGSGSGKTRFWLKPNLMQCHSSYCVTDPKGTVLIYERSSGMNENKITALYERLSKDDKERSEESLSIQNQKLMLEQYAKNHGFRNIAHYTDDDESGRFFDRPGYVHCAGTTPRPTAPSSSRR